MPAVGNRLPGLYSPPAPLGNIPWLISPQGMVSGPFRPGWVPQDYFRAAPEMERLPPETPDFNQITPEMLGSPEERARFLELVALLARPDIAIRGIMAQRQASV